MPATTLFKMATQAAIRLSAQITDLADMPYRIARPFLLKIQSPQQLRDIEINCPHIAEADEELWRAFIARDIPDYKDKIVEPKNKNSWHKVYRYLQRKEEKKAAEDEEALRKSMAGEGLKKAEKETLFVRKVLPHARAEDEHDFYVDGVANTKRHGGAERKKQPTLKNAKTGKEMLSAIRKQASDASKSRAGFTSLTPQSAAQRLANAKRQINQAPPSMARQANPAHSLTIKPRDLLPHEKVMMKEIQQQRKNTKIQPPTRKVNAQIAERNQPIIDAAARKARADNEARLRALTQQSRKRPAEAMSPPGRPYDFAPSPVITESAKRASPPTTSTSQNAVGRTPTVSSPSAANAQSPPKQPVATSIERAPTSQASPSSKTATPQAKSISPECSPPQKMVKKRPAPGSIFMNTNKKRKI